MWRLVLAESDRKVTDRVNAAFANDERFRIVAVAQTSESASRIAQVVKPDMLIANLELGNLVQSVMANAPTHIVAYATSGNITDLQLKQALDRGAEESFLLKNERQLVSFAEKWCEKPKPEARRHGPVPSGTLKSGVVRKQLPPRVVVIGASLGGPAALELLVRAWPATFPLPIVVAQHMTAGFSKDMVQWLNTLRSVRVKLAETGETLAPSTMYFAPDGMHVTVTSHEELRLTPADADEANVPSVNTLFSSAAKSFSSAAVGVLLTGMGEDGAQGLQEMMSKGARTVAQNQETSTAFGMPQAAIKLGSASVVLPLGDIAHYVLECAQRGRN